MLLTGVAGAQSYSRSEHRYSMGTAFDVTVVSLDSNTTSRAITAAWAEVERIEKLISSWDSNSQTHLINKNAGIKPVVVDSELFGLIERSIKVSKLTEGAFDISYASLDKVWDFKDSTLRIPSKESIQASIQHIGYEKIQLNHALKSVFLLDSGMKIGFGAIGKGYTANKVKELMLAMGITGGMVNAGGDLIAWGTKGDGSPWKVGIADPKKKGNIFAFLPIMNGAVVTSGNYERFLMIEGQRYAHILDPRTGYPVTGLKSVTILCPDAEIADALATAVFVLGETKGLSLINQLNEIEAILVNDSDEIITSKNIQLNE